MPPEANAPAAAAPTDRAVISAALPRECSAPLAFQMRARMSTVDVARAGAALGATRASQWRAVRLSFKALPPVCQPMPLAASATADTNLSTDDAASVEA